VVDKIAIVVNNEVITQREVDRMLAPIYEQCRAVYQGVELAKKMTEARNAVINQLIEDKLILSEAKRLNIEVDAREVNARMDDVIKRLGSQERFESLLAQEGLTRKTLFEHYREQVMVKRLIDQKVGSNISISPTEINNYYKQHANEFISPEQVKVNNILIRARKGGDANKALEQAKEIERRIREGCDFAALAKEYSDGPNASEGGSMGFVKRGDLMPDIEAMVFRMKEGEVSGLIKTDLGYHLFKVEEKKEREIRSLAEVRRDVEDAIYKEKMRGKLKGWIESLRKNAYIAFK
jgi:parvulin-like peptidyl-prolyl isomerase